jgi:cation transport regulator ChaC
MLLKESLAHFVTAFVHTNTRLLSHLPKRLACLFPNTRLRGLCQTMNQENSPKVVFGLPAQKCTQQIEILKCSEKWYTRNMLPAHTQVECTVRTRYICGMYVSAELHYKENHSLDVLEEHIRRV